MDVRWTSYHLRITGSTNITTTTVFSRSTTMRGAICRPYAKVDLWVGSHLLTPNTHHRYPRRG